MLSFLSPTNFSLCLCLATELVLRVLIIVDMFILCMFLENTLTRHGIGGYLAVFRGDGSSESKSTKKINTTAVTGGNQSNTTVSNVRSTADSVQSLNNEVALSKVEESASDE